MLIVSAEHVLHALQPEPDASPIRQRRHDAVRRAVTRYFRFDSTLAIDASSFALLPPLLDVVRLIAVVAVGLLSLSAHPILVRCPTHLTPSVHPSSSSFVIVIFVVVHHRSHVASQSRPMASEREACVLTALFRGRECPSVNYLTR